MTIMTGGPTLFLGPTAQPDFLAQPDSWAQPYSRAQPYSNGMYRLLISVVLLSNMLGLM